MKYSEFINKLIKEKISATESVVLFGQNITKGSCLSGLTKNLKTKKGLIINTQNSENSLCGIGFGLILGGISSIFFMKQQDFLLLGIDHLVNTYNFIRRKKISSSFTIVPIVIDNGYQGLQSSLNNLSDFCSISRTQGFTITNKSDAENIINSQLISPGFRMIGVSQRLFQNELIDVGKIYSNNENTLFQYTRGSFCTIVCFNFSLPYGLELHTELKKNNLESSLFSVNAFLDIKWDIIFRDLKITKKLVVIDDSKSGISVCSDFLAKIPGNCKIDKKLVLRRDFAEDWLSPNADQLKINYQKIIKILKWKKKY